MGNTTNTINIGSMHNSQIQQDTENLKQKIEQISYQTDLNNFLESFARDISKVQDQPTVQALRADMETIKIQNNASSPKKGVIKECLLSMKNILEGTAGSILASYVPVILPLIACL